MSRFTLDLDSPRVRIPPPVSIPLMLVLSWILTRIAPSPFLPDSLRLTVGWGVILAGVGMVLWCGYLFREHQTAIQPWKPTLQLVRKGPYQFSRNPIYVSFLVMGLGIACAMNNAFALFLLIPMALFLRYYVIDREEQYLTRKFGAEYQAFCRTTRRWV